MKNRCFYLDRRHALTLVEEPLPEPGPDEAVVRVAANGICGSDVHFFREGRLGNFVVEEPYIPGHECSGTVHAVGKHVENMTVGDKVTIEPGIPCGRCPVCKSGRYNLCPSVVFLSEPGVNGTLRDYVPVRADMLHRLPGSMDLALGALVEPTAVAVHAMGMAGDLRGKTAAIFGAGPIGLLTLLAFRAAGGGRAVCLDINEARLRQAAQLGADDTVLNREGTEIDKICDVAFETAGAPAATAGLFRAVRPGGYAVQVGWPAGNVVNMDIATFMEKEITYIGLNRYANAYPAAIAWLVDGRIPGERLITHRYSFEETPEAFAYTAAHPDEVIKTVLFNHPPV